MSFRYWLPAAANNIMQLVSLLVTCLMLCKGSGTLNRSSIHCRINTGQTTLFDHCLSFTVCNWGFLTLYALLALSLTFFAGDPISLSQKIARVSWTSSSSVPDISRTCIVRSRSSMRYWWFPRRSEKMHKKYTRFLFLERGVILWCVRLDV